MKYELYYSNGGHGGPYQDFDAAVEGAHNLLRGDKNMQGIEARPYNSEAKGGYAINHVGSTYFYKEPNQTDIRQSVGILPKGRRNQEAIDAANEALAEQNLAQHDDDPNPYHGDYSED
jgi:hypothetical protein